jgi:hypothetical protein
VDGQYVLFRPQRPRVLKVTASPKPPTEARLGRRPRRRKHHEPSRFHLVQPRPQGVRARRGPGRHHAGGRLPRPHRPVATSTGRFKKYTEKHRFRIPNTLRALGGRATELRFEASDQTYNCEPHALDYPVDNLEQLEAEGLENVLREGAVAVAEVAALAHEKTVIDQAPGRGGRRHQQDVERQPPTRWRTWTTRS